LTYRIDPRPCNSERPSKLFHITSQRTLFGACFFRDAKACQETRSSRTSRRLRIPSIVFTCQRAAGFASLGFRPRLPDVAALSRRCLGRPAYTAVGKPCQLLFLTAEASGLTRPLRQNTLSGASTPLPRYRCATAVPSEEDGLYSRLKHRVKLFLSVSAAAGQVIPSAAARRRFYESYGFVSTPF